MQPAAAWSGTANRAMLGRHGEEPMIRRIGRLFSIRTRVDALLVIYVLALGAVERGSAYLVRFPGLGGKLLFLACTAAVFMAGAKLLDAVRERDGEGSPAQADSSPTV